MKRTLVSALLVSATFAAAVPAFAQSNEGLTREQVRQQLVVAQASGQLEQQRAPNAFPANRPAVRGEYAVATQHSAARYAKVAVPSNAQE
ncbi:DUF4148 domain-containing protein [Pararobbsia silviterrae]|nr:DUF4148 domain-containing protein [Pararobbsia silviterrae]